MIKELNQKLGVQFVSISDNMPADIYSCGSYTLNYTPADSTIDNKAYWGLTKNSNPTNVFVVGFGFYPKINDEIIDGILEFMQS